jgi:hypothetical protein
VTGFNPEFSLARREGDDEDWDLNESDSENGDDIGH